MRIACIHIPQFALQCASRLDPSLRGAPVAVVGGASIDLAGRERSGPLHAPVVLACSRAAWTLGVRLGMTATAARSQSPQIEVVTADAANQRETVRALADALLGLTGIVDTGGRVGAGGAHFAMYAQVPTKTRGATFGDRLLELIEELGLTGRIGIADDRFTAWVAAAHGGVPYGIAPSGDSVGPRRRALDPSVTEDKGVLSVPRGGSPAFLSPRPLSLLAITPEVQHMLEALGVRTLGEFAALPAPSVARPLEADYQALARGESGADLRPYNPEAPIREEIIVRAGNELELTDLLPARERTGALTGPAAIALISRRIALRLEGRARGAARLDISAMSSTATCEVPVTLDRAITEDAELARVLAPALEGAAAEIAAASAHEPWRLRVVVAGESIIEGETQTEVASAAPHFAFASASSSHSMAARAVPDRHDHVESDIDGSISPLAMVLSSSGSLFALSPPSLRSERRDAHRRTRRGKQRRARPTPFAQSRLFDRTSSK